MDILQEGATGPDVTALQSRLKERGFSPGAIDGNFGPGTTAALIAFQKSQWLSADGILGGRTAIALGFQGADSPASAGSPAAAGIPNVTIAIAAKMFPATPLDHITANLPHVMKALEAAALTTTPIVLAALATIRAETEGFMPISEMVSRFNTSPGGTSFDLYDKRADLGNRGAPDGANFKGRGYVQLTGRSNYTKFGPLVGVPNLVNTPDLANDPDVAAKILAAFIASKEAAIEAALMLNDLAAARRLVNGGSNGLDRFSAAYQIGIALLSPTA